MSRAFQEMQDFFRETWEGPDWTWTLGIPDSLESGVGVGGLDTLLHVLFLPPHTGLRNHVAGFTSGQFWIRSEEAGMADWREILRRMS